MKQTFDEAMESALRQAMIEDPSVFLLGEDLHGLRRNLFTQFGRERVRSTPISESAFVGAAITAAMAGLRPVVEVMLVDFLGVAMDAIINHLAKNTYFSGNKWKVPLVIRASCGGGYGDGGQHEQSLWGWLAHIPGLSVAVPSTPADAGSLLYTAIKSDHPTIFLEHKLLADTWLEAMGSGGRKTVNFAVPERGRLGAVPKKWEIVDQRLKPVRRGDDITLVSIGVGVHQCLEVARELEPEGISAEVLDLRYVAPPDREGILNSVSATGKLVVVDEDYLRFGLSGEIAAGLLEEGIEFGFRRVGTPTTIPFDHSRELETLPNKRKIIEACRELLN